MSAELQSRPAASRGGRSATRGGRGGFAGRGSSRRTNGEAKGEDSLESIEDEGEIGQLKKLHGQKTLIVKEMFPDWSEVDILFALRETDGDVEQTVTGIAEGHISQWDEVSKSKKERAKAKAKEPVATVDAAATRVTRNGGAGPDKTRGRASARATDRGGRSARGRSAQPTNGARPEKNPLSVPTEESQAYESQTAFDDATATPDQTSTDAPTPVPANAGPKTWASMLRQSTAPPPKPITKPKEAPPAQKSATETTEYPPTSASETAADPAATFDESSAGAEPEAEEEEAPAKPAAKESHEVAIPAVAVPEVSLAPSKDELTESNLEQVFDESHPLDSDTIHSEAADSWDPRSAALAGTNTPISASQQQHQGVSAKTLGSGYATTAIKATDRMAIRTPSYSRRILDQEEAVRMPVNRDVERATVQFGALSFTGAVDEDIDGDREEPETRAQPPDDSPVAHPRASLPPVAPPAAVTDAFGKQAAAGPSTTNLPTPSAATPTAPAAVQAQQPIQGAQQYGRYGQTGAQEASYGQKPFESTYGQPAQAPAATNQHYDNYQSVPASSQVPAQQAPPAFSSAPNEYSQYFTSDAQSRNPYNNYYQAYGQQAAQGHQEGAQNQRSYGGYPLNDSLSQYPQSNTSRFGGAAAASTAVAADAQNSGTTTPNPPMAGQQQSQQHQTAQAQHSQQQHQGSQYQSYSQQHPYYASPYYAQYVNQYGSFGQGNFGGPYGKGGYGGAQHHPYGMSPQTPYDHSATQGSNFSGASSLRHGADSSTLASSGLSDYGRVGAGQSVGQQSSFGGSHDGSFARGGAGAYQSQAGQYGAQQQVGAQQTGADDLKPYGEAKGAAGPSPSLARPGSATNTQASQSGLPPPQSGQQGGVGGYGGYPSHLQHGGLHGNQTATGGGYAANQNHSNNPYGSYGHGAHSGHGQQGFGGNNNYYNNQQRGWGGNYH